MLEKLGGHLWILLKMGEFGRDFAAVAEGHFKEGDSAGGGIEEDAEGFHALGELGIFGKKAEIYCPGIIFQGNDFEAALEFFEGDGQWQGEILHGPRGSRRGREPAGAEFFGFDDEEVAGRFQHEELDRIADLPAEAALGAEPDGAGFSQRNAQGGQAPGLDEIGAERADAGLFGNPIAKDGVGILGPKGKSGEEKQEEEAEAFHGRLIFPVGVRGISSTKRISTGTL